MTRELLFSITAKDLKFESFTVGGAGGQGRDHVNTGVRYTHPASGAKGECREHREQGRNKKVALKRLTEDPRFTWWVHQRTLELDNKETAEERVARDLADPAKIRVERKNSRDQWEVWTD